MSVITKDLGVATAYGYAKSKGYTGTEEEFAELMASYADVAQQAEAAAQDAEDAKDAAVSAKNDAVTAKTAAQAAQSAAETASGTATTKASEAAQSAQSAAGSASAAQTSATAASGSASTAQTAAQTATNKASEASSSASAASTAKTGAETARTGAQTAQANAEAAASSVSASAAQIEQNTEDIAGLKNDLTQLAPTVTIEESKTINSSSFTFIGNRTISADGAMYDNDQYRAYYYQFTEDGVFSMQNLGNSSYGFIALFNGTPSNGSFVERKYNGSNPSDMTPFAVSAGQSVFVSVNLLSTINFNTYLTVEVEHTPSLFRHEMKVAWFGDSISQLQLLPHRVSEYMANTVYDCSFAGSALTYGSTKYGGMSVRSISSQIANGNYSALEESLDNQEADGIDVTQKRINAATLEGIDFSNDVTDIVIMAGTNDLNNDYVTTTTDLTAFKTGVQDIINNFNNAFPHLRLYFITDPYRGDVTPSAPDRHGHSLIDINDAIKEVCEKNNIVFFDLYHCSGINAQTVGYFLMNDQLHQNENGDILLAQKCAKWLSAN